MSQPSSSIVISSIPKPCTPSTQKSTRSSGSRDSLTSRIAAAIAASGTLTPVPECTQVTAKTRVLSVIALRVFATISSTDVVAGSA